MKSILDRVNRTSRWLPGLLLVLALATGCFAPTDILQVIIRVSPDPGFPTQAMTFDASSSSAGNKGISTYQWNFSDGYATTGMIVQHAFPTPGSYTARLTITSASGESAMESRTIVVLDVILVPGHYSTIQAAIDAAHAGDRIVVAAGTYEESLQVRKDITLQCSDPSDPAAVDSTIIRGREYGRPTVTIGNGSQALVEGFTILAGPSLSGAVCGACAGVVHIREASPAIRGNKILNSGDTGIAIYESKAVIEGNTISNNAAQLPGGGIVVDSYRVAPVITRNLFEGNSAPSGGAIFITASGAREVEASGAASAIVSGNTFRSNTATTGIGGAIYVEYMGNLRLDSPDSNTYVDNYPDDVRYVVPPTP
ncbi:PKD domain-containing protein [Candidatus Bipolaricaulota bacterium]